MYTGRFMKPYDDKIPYDWYYYRGKYYTEIPKGSIPVKYQKCDYGTVAYCKKDRSKLRPLLYIAISVLCMGSIYFISTSFKDIPEVSKYVPKFVEHKSETLVSNVVEVGKLKYNKYAIYEDGVLYPYIYSKTGQVQFKVGDKVSELIDADSVTEVNLDLGLQPEDIVEGVVVYHLKDNVKEYPIIIEYPEPVVKVEKELGTVPSTEAVETDSHGNIIEETEPDFRTYQETDTDWENWSVIQYGDYFQ